ncbi:MAG TPA: CaiB/BaiF CoA-transferase family protein [Acetobacteraceae bacterium]|jgi:crotonobetainyl-CoA:carnitine CoA-transferase CaiB-like acyl-CoA transferase
MDYDAAFAGLKVIDLTGGVAGPSCAMMLAQHGANVIKVETPHGGGDWSRILGRRYEDHSAFSVYGTLGKRSVAIDLKTDEGRAILWRLLHGADVFMEGFRPGTIKRYGFDYATVSEREPQIVYYAISGFGQTGPLASRPAMDPVLQAFIGIVTENRGEHDNHPHRIAISLIDMFTGLLGFQAIATSLYVRREQKRGRFLEASLMQGGAMLSVIRMIANYLERGTTQRTSMPNGVFNTADGQINVTMVRPDNWGPFCEALEQRALLTDARFAEPRARGEHLDELLALLRPVFASKPTAWLAERFTAAGIMNGRVNSYEEFLREPQVEATGIMAWLDQPGFSEQVPMPNIPGLPAFENGSKRAHAPRLGEHTVEVLEEHGYTRPEIEGLIARKVVGVAGA